MREGRNEVDPTPAQTADVPLAVLSDDQLIHLRAAVETEMKLRGLQYDVGRFGEQLAISFFNGTPACPNLLLAPTGTKNVDALSRDGERYSIKTICRGKKTGTVYPDTNNPDKQLFEHLLIVKLTVKWELEEIFQIDWQQFVSVRSWDKRMNAWYVPYSSRVTSIAKKIVAA
ncbi:MAG: hypothetical protein KGZ68_18365 [Dechloromonas sp.]|nr:hypothetical protein [Dechloromonas sp.]